MSDERGHTAKTARFWEARGRIDSKGHVTLMAEHARYTAFIHARELAVLERLVEPSSRVLDVGCGTGRLAVAIAPRCREVVGIDVAASLIERARDAGRVLTNVTFHHHAAERPFSYGTFDLVMLSGVLNYLDDADAARALTQCVASLAPTARLYMRNNCGVGSRRYEAGGPDLSPTIHRTREEYLAMVQGAGLVVDEEHYLFPPLCLPNMVYYHALPARLRDNRVVGRLLDAWFAAEAATADVRLRYLSAVYDPIMRAIGKDTALHVIVARRASP